MVVVTIFIIVKTYQTTLLICSFLYTNHISVKLLQITWQHLTGLERPLKHLTGGLDLTKWELLTCLLLVLALLFAITQNPENGVAVFSFPSPTKSQMESTF